jgi:hypothetical protein
VNHLSVEEAALQFAVDPEALANVPIGGEQMPLKGVVVDERRAVGLNLNPESFRPDARLAAERQVDLRPSAMS